MRGPVMRLLMKSLSIFTAIVRSSNRRIQNHEG